MVKIGAKIRDFREYKGLSRRAFADGLGVPEGKIQKIEMDAQRADHEFLSNLAKSYGINLNLLLDETSETAVQKVRGITTDTVNVPIMSVALSAGAGSVSDEEAELATYPASLQWLNELRVNAGTVYFLPVSGDSMEPDFMDGDFALIETRTLRSIPDGKICAVRYSGGLFLKRLQVRGSSYRLISSNQFYEPIDIENPDAEDFEIIGVVAAALRNYKTILR